MPRTAIVPITLVRDSSVVTPTATTIDATLVTNGVVIASGPVLSRLIITINNTAATPKTVTFRKGTNPPAALASQGDVVLTVANAVSRDFGPFTSGKYTQADGSFNIDFEAGFTGGIMVRQIPNK